MALDRGTGATTSNVAKFLNSKGRNYSVAHLSTVRNRAFKAGLLEKATDKNIESGIQQTYVVSELGKSAISFTIERYKEQISLSSFAALEGSES